MLGLDYGYKHALKPKLGQFQACQDLEARTQNVEKSVGVFD